jgi:hypothetical protein
VGINFNVFLQEKTGHDSIIISSQDDGRFRLEDYKIELGKIGLETGKLEFYQRQSREWIPISRRMPIPVRTLGELIFIKHESVVSPRGLSEILVLDGDEPTRPEVLVISSDEDEPPSSPCDRKAKRSRRI